MQNTKKDSTSWWLLSEHELSLILNTDLKRGLSTQEAHKRLLEFGPNQILKPQPISAFHLFIAQFANLLVWILIAAAMLAGVLQEWIDALAIMAIIVLNALLGFFQEYKAAGSLAALSKLITSSSKVIRDGKLLTVPSKNIVPGDIVLVEAGDQIPADGRFVRIFDLATQEAALTGESLPVHKIAKALEDQTPILSDITNMGFLGTSALKGKGYLLVTETGFQTEMGKIASLLQQGNGKVPQTPLQIKLQELGVRILWLCLGIICIVFILGYIKGAPLIENMLISISLAVAAIPEGLPAIATITLSIGVHKMAKCNALVRRLASVETLGCTSVICTDKTGTLTENQMTVRCVWVNNTYIDVTGSGYDPVGGFEINHIPIDPQNIPELQISLKIGVLCNSADLHQTQDPLVNWNITGDPTEGALLTVAGKSQLFKQELEAIYPTVSEIPFDAERKRMSVVRQTDAGLMLYIKGAPDILLMHAKYLLENGQLIPLTPEIINNIHQAISYLAGQAFRVIAVGYRNIPKTTRIDHNLENELIFVGLFAMIDPPRPEVAKSIASCVKAGITTVMITGDHKDTAVGIAKEINLLKPDSMILTGAELDEIDDENLMARLRNIAIYARTTASHKLRIVRAWKSLGEVIAMTGDGVNDALALKEANIGIAMGMTGTDVAKEASDMIITDDNFATIVHAIEAGRGIYDNISKFVHYLASSNIAEIIVVFMGMLLGFTDISGDSFVPLSAVQILWINLVSDGLPAIALGFDTLNPSSMTRSPRKSSDALISRKKALHLLCISVAIAVGTLVSCYYGIHHSAALAQTMAFTTLVILEFVAIQVIRSPYNLNFVSNPYLIAAVIIGLLLHMLILYTSFFQSIFKTVPINSSEWGIIATIAIVVWLLCTAINKIFKPKEHTVV